MVNFKAVYAYVYIYEAAVAQWLEHSSSNEMVREILFGLFQL